MMRVGPKCKGRRGGEGSGLEVGARDPRAFPARRAASPPDAVGSRLCYMRLWVRHVRAGAAGVPAFVISSALGY